MQMPNIVVDPVEANRLATLTMQTLRRLNVPALPVSYSVFFMRHSGQAPELSMEVAAMLASPGTASAQQCAHIYDRFFSAGRLLTQIGEALAGMAGPVEAIDRLLSESDHHAHALAEIQDELTGMTRASSSEPDRGALRRAADRLAGLSAETEKLRAAMRREVAQSRASFATAQRRFAAEHAAARTDPLTRLGNRRYLDEEMARTPHGALIMADIDHFKRFNDLHGHKAGDLVLVAFGRILRRVAGEHGIVARFGGEEFVLFLPAAPLEEAARLADRARAMIEHMASITTKNGATLSKITASFGVAASRPGDRPEQLIERADAALYRAKNGGRNRVAGSEGA